MHLPSLKASAGGDILRYEVKNKVFRVFVHKHASLLLSSSELLYTLFRHFTISEPRYDAETSTSVKEVSVMNVSALYKNSTSVTFSEDMRSRRSS